MNLDAWDTLMGAVIALVGVGISEWNGRRREANQRAHDDRIRFHKEAVDACASFLLAQRLLLGFIGRARRRGSHQLTAEELAEMDKLSRDRGEAVERLALITSRTVNDAAKDLYDFVNDNLGGPSVNDDDDVFSSKVAQLQEKRARLRTALRNELGVPHPAA